MNETRLNGRLFIVVGMVAVIGSIAGGLTSIWYYKTRYPILVCYTFPGVEGKTTEIKNPDGSTEVVTELRSEAFAFVKEWPIDLGDYVIASSVAGLSCGGTVGLDGCVAVAA